MSTTRLLLCCFLLLAGIGSLQAQDQKTTWSLQECVDYAFANSINVKRSQLQFDADRANLFQSKAAFLPSVNAGANYFFNAGRSLDPVNQEFITSNQQTSNVSLNGSLVLFQGGQRIKSIKQTQSAAEASQYTVEQSKYTVGLNVALFYLQVISNQELLEIARNQVAQSELQVRRTQKLVEAGSLPQTNLLDLQAQLAVDKASLVTAQNNLNLAKLNLMQAMNLPAQNGFEVVPVQVGDLNIAPYERTAAEVYAIAEKTLPSVKSADLIVQSSIYGVQMAKGALYPSLAAVAGLNTNYSDQSRLLDDANTGGGSGPTGEVIGFVRGNNQAPVFRESILTTQPATREYPYFRQLNDNLSNFVGLRLNIPIINGWQTRTQISRAVVQKKLNELDALNTRVLLRQEIEQAYINMLAAAASYVSFKEQVSSLELAFQATESRFNVGLLNSVDYNLAKVNLDRARANLVATKYDYIFRTKILDFYQNKPLSF
jgi:outer membrane protein